MEWQHHGLFEGVHITLARGMDPDRGCCVGLKGAFTDFAHTTDEERLVIDANYLQAFPERG